MMCMDLVGSQLMTRTCGVDWYALLSSRLLLCNVVQPHDRYRIAFKTGGMHSHLWL